MSIISMNASNVNYEQYKKNLLMAAITSILIMGTSIIPMQSYADQHKKTTDFKASIKVGSEVDKKSASQKLDQDNFCYRGENCQQGNEGQQLVGKGNDAAGFNDQSTSIQQQQQPTISTPSQVTPGNGTTPAPIMATCEQCFTKFLSQGQIDLLLANLSSTDFGGSLTNLCTGLKSGTTFLNLESNFRVELSQIAGVTDPTTIDRVIACLKEFGVVFT
jgi:hypothetical protein